MTTWVHVFAGCPEVHAPAVQLWLARTDEQAQLLVAANPALAVHAWKQLYTTRPLPPPKTARALINGPSTLTAEQLAWVLVHDRRASTTQELLRRPAVAWTPALLAAKAAETTSTAVVEGVARQLVDIGQVREAVRLLDRCGAAARIVVLAVAAAADPDRAQLSPEQAARYVNASVAENDPLPPSQVIALRELLDSMPALIDLYATSDSVALNLLAARSRHLQSLPLQLHLAQLPTTRYLPEQVRTSEPTRNSRFRQASPPACGDVLRSLADNPTVSLEVVAQIGHACTGVAQAGKLAELCSQRLHRYPYTVTGAYEDVHDPATLAWLIQRSTGRTLHWPDVTALLDNPHLPPGHAQHLIDQIADLAGHRLQAQQAAAVARLAGRMPMLDVPTSLAPSCKAATGQPDTDRTDRWQDSSEQYLHTPTAQVRPGTDHALAAAVIVSRELADNLGAWQFFLGFVDGFDGTFLELIEQARLLG